MNENSETLHYHTMIFHRISLKSHVGSLEKIVVKVLNKLIVLLRLRIQQVRPYASG